MSVSAQHKQYIGAIAKWQLVRDVVNSDVKSYIKDIDKCDIERCKRYKDDARLTNFTVRTQNGLVGAVMRKEPKKDFPSYMQYIIDDATGNHLSIDKLTQESVKEVLLAGRYGLLVDYPASEEGLTVAQVKQLDLKARIYRYNAESIINWAESKVNGQFKLSLVVLKEEVSSLGEDGFSWQSTVNYRVLRLIDGIYTQLVYDAEEKLISEYQPRDFSGNYWDFIPFIFIGSEDNDPVVDAAPLYDLAELNIGHYRNSADYEESVHVTGQPTLILSTDLSVEQFNAANPNGVLIGSRRGHNLGAGGNAFLLQASPNQLADEAMKRKEEQAVMIGARLIMQASSNETAEAARIKHSGENSVLSTIAKNVEEAIENCLYWVARFMSNEVDPTIEFEINDTFFDKTLDAQMIMAQLQLLTSGVVSISDVRDVLRETGNLNPERTDDDIDEEISNVDPLTGGFNGNNTD